MSRLRAPGPNPPPEPADGWVFAVRWTDRRGQSVTHLRRRACDAHRLADDIYALGGRPTVHRARLAGWTLEAATSETIR